MTHCPNPANQERLQFYSRSRPCRGLAAHLLSHSGPGGFPDHCVIRVCLLLAECPQGPFGNILGIFCLLGISWESLGNLLGTSWESLVEIIYDTHYKQYNTHYKQYSMYYKQYY